MRNRKVEARNFDVRKEIWRMTTLRMTNVKLFTPSVMN